MKRNYILLLSKDKQFYIITKVIVNTYRLSGTDATSSFSGYLYQADVALLVTLEKIDVLKSIPNELDKWFLEVEGEEDFSLIKKEGDSVIEKHLYQVKEYEGTAAGKYHEAVVKLFRHYTEASGSVNNSYYICSKKRINVDDMDEYITRLKQSNDADVLFQKCLCRIQDDVPGLLEIYNEYLSDSQHKTANLVKFIKELSNNDDINTPFSSKVGTIGDGGFLDNFSFGEIGGYGEFTDIHIKIKVILRLLNSRIDPEYHLRHFESQIKRYIQERKNNMNSIPVSIKQIYSDIGKDTNDIISLIMTDYGYEEIFYDHFITTFCDSSKEHISIVNFPFLNGKNQEEIYSFTEGFLEKISKNIFQNKEKLKDFIKHTSPHKSNQYLDERNRSNLESLLGGASRYIQEDLIERKIATLVRLHYLSLSYKGEYDLNGYINNGKLGIRKNNKSAICIGTAKDRSNIREIISNNPQYLFEHDYLGIRETSGTILDFIHKEGIEKGFDCQGTNNSYEKNHDNIRKIGDVRFFCLGCHEHFMDSDCGSIEDCPHKNLY